MKEILSKTRTSPHKRLQYIYDMAKTKSICDGGDKLDKNFDQSLAEEVKVVIISLHGAVILFIMF